MGDITLPGMLHVVLLRSPHAHARIRRVDAARAREHPGVADVVTFGDLGPYDEAGQLQAGSYLDYLLPTPPTRRSLMSCWRAVRIWRGAHRVGMDAARNGGEIEHGLHGKAAEGA